MDCSSKALWSLAALVRGSASCAALHTLTHSPARPPARPPTPANKQESNQSINLSRSLSLSLSVALSLSLSPSLPLPFYTVALPRVIVHTHFFRESSKLMGQLLYPDIKQPCRLKCSAREATVTSVCRWAGEGIGAES